MSYNEDYNEYDEYGSEHARTDAHYAEGYTDNGMEQQADDYIEQQADDYIEPKYTLRWLGLQTLYILGIAFIMALIARGIDSFALSRQSENLLTASRYSFLTQSISYCAVVIAITSFSLMLIEVAFRKGINYIQYGLIGGALCLFNLLLLAMSEQLPFAIAYIIVSAMTVGLIVWFIREITKNRKAVALTTAILAAEYGLIFILINLGSMALLIGSLMLFILLGLAMYFTLKLKVENKELVLK